MLSRVPQAEKFAKFWICKAKLLTQSGPFDVMGLYKAAVCAGAVVRHDSVRWLPVFPASVPAGFLGFWDEFSSVSHW